MESDHINLSVKSRFVALCIAFFAISGTCSAHDAIQPGLIRAEINLAGSLYQQNTALDNCTAYFNGNAKFVSECRFGEVPPQVASWLFILAILGFAGFLNRNKL